MAIILLTAVSTQAPDVGERGTDLPQRLIGLRQPCLIGACRLGSSSFRPAPSCTAPTDHFCLGQQKVSATSKETKRCTC